MYLLRKHVVNEIDISALIIRVIFCKYDGSRLRVSTLVSYYCLKCKRTRYVKFSARIIVLKYLSNLQNRFYYINIFILLVPISKFGRPKVRHKMCALNTIFRKQPSKAVTNKISILDCTITTYPCTTLRKPLEYVFPSYSYFPILLLSMNKT